MLDLLTDAHALQTCKFSHTKHTTSPFRSNMLESITFIQYFVCTFLYSRHFEEDFVWQICYQIILALKECHSRNKNGKVVLHRDLKPANIFLDAQNNVKLGDFGLARVLNHETSFAKTFVGTPYYMSPVSTHTVLNALNYSCSKS